jgi:transcriptional regulator with XRE-family HTH domain
MDESELPQRFGSAVRQLRLDRGISQERLAALAGIDRAYMGYLERGQRNPTLVTIHRVAKALELPMSELVHNVEQ